MGGFGSTRWGSTNTRQTVESIRALDIRASGIEQLAPIVWMPCQFGGWRRYFRCLVERFRVIDMLYKDGAIMQHVV
jgi:hypothetical protein